MCGPYLGLVTEYLDCAKRRGLNLRDVRKLIRPFFVYLQQHDILSLQAVSSTTVTQFRSWGLKNGHRSAATDTSALSTFFQWALVEGHYEGQNPVLPALHGKLKKPQVGTAILGTANRSIGMRPSPAQGFRGTPASLSRSISKSRTTLVCGTRLEPWWKRSLHPTYVRAEQLGSTLQNSYREARSRRIRWPSDHVWSLGAAHDYYLRR